MRGGGRVGLESQGGVIRADTSGVRVWRWVGDRCGTEARCASAHGSGGGAERSSGAAEEDGTSGGEDGCCGGVGRVDSGVGPQGSARRGVRMINDVSNTAAHTSDTPQLLLEHHLKELR